MIEFANFIFNNFFLFVIIALIFYLYKEYKDLKEKTASINDLFTKTLDKYLQEKINMAKETTDRILKEYGREDTVSTEISRLLLMIEKGVSGGVNDKVATSNAINKFKLSKKIDFKRYPYLLELEKLGTFTEEDMNSQDNGIAIARREYNAQAFRYNEKTSSFIMQYLTKYTKLTQQYAIFDAPKASNYDDNYEVFEEEEPEINSLTILNREKDEEENLNDLLLKNKEDEDIVIEHNDNILKPTIDLDDDKKN